MTSALGVSESGYYRFRKRASSTRSESDRRLVETVRDLHAASRQTYGSPSIHQQLRQSGMAVGRKRVERLMHEHRIVGLMPKRRRVVTTDSRHEHPIADNVLDRDFTAAGANQKWTSDITYIWTSEGWLYLASVIDLFSRRVVGWSMSDRIDQHLTLAALQMAVQRRQPADGLLHHSDRGSQYCATAYRQMLSDWGMIPSMSRNGNCWDNVVIESWHRTLKVELVYRQRYRSRAEARASIFEYIEGFYNRERRHSTLGYLSPDQFERQHAADS
ncbi:MAG: putative integrase [Chlorobi bacterium]|nr:putative integrase [Chlorobiota bacterium]